MPSAQQEACRAAMQANGAAPSRLQRSVGHALAEVQPGFEEEAVEPQTGYSLDLALGPARVAIEVDGPSHYLRCLHGRGEQQLPNGATLLKRRLLKAAGWCVVSVPYYEWDALRGEGEQRGYLEQRVRGMGAA